MTDDPGTVAGTDSMTVAIISIAGDAALVRCAAAVRASGAHFITVDRSGRCCDSAGRVLRDGSALSVPARRRLAAESVHSRFVAFVEDTVVPEKTWLGSIDHALEQGDVGAVGGPVAISPLLPWRYRALALTEYGRFSAHGFPRLAVPGQRRAGPVLVTALPGANFAFRTAALLAAMPHPDDGLVDNEIFARLRSDGHAIAYEPAMGVVYGEKHEAGARLSTRFHHGRIYAGRRYADASAGRRAIAAVKTLALPPVLFSRTLGEAVRSRQFSFGTMLWVTAMHMCWSVGEFTGIVLGPPRDGVDRWT